jgi:glycosyltransferase involved in cell wall biosynthesis
VPKVSVLIPSRNERFLKATVKDVLAKAAGDVEVIVTLEGYWPKPPLPEDPRLSIVHFGVSHGMRPAINAAAACARGEYLMKCDAHCMFDGAWDEKLKADCEDNWVVIPRRHSLDAENWAISRGRPPYDYHYLSWPFVSCPVDEKGAPQEIEDKAGIHGRWWRQRQEARKDILIDDEMSSQGSCWFMSRKHWDRLGGLGVDGYGTFIQEFQEVGCKTWLGGGMVKVNKKTWYAHLHKGRRYGRGYSGSPRSWAAGRLFSADYWMNNRWPERQHDFDWLVDRFWPVPSWPENWRDYDYGRLSAGKGH